MNVYPIIEEEERRHWLDWRFLAALTALLFLALIVFGAWRNYELREVEAAQRDTLIAQLDERAGHVETLQEQMIILQDRLDAVRTQARADRIEARQERRTLLRQQAFMIRLLQRYGIVPRSTRIPDSVTFTPAPRRATPRESEQESSPSRRLPQAKAPRPGGGTATPKPPTAGRSGKTPSGKAKGLKP